MVTAQVEVGTLIVVILKAKNLPNKRHIGKQDPYCTVRHNGETRRSKAVKRGGQHPEWDEEVRFTIYEDSGSSVAQQEEPSALAPVGDEPPPPPPKKEKDKKIKGGIKMHVSCFADDPREPDLIGETDVDLTEVLTKGETDEWFTLMNKEKYCGEVYLELTFWSNEKPPEKKPVPQASSFNPQYGGPGSFTPSAEIPAALKHGGSSPNHQNAPSPSRIPTLNGAAVPHALRPSSSLASIDLYKAPYERQSRYSDVDQLAGRVNDLSIASGSSGSGGRRESYPPNANVGLSEFGYAGPGAGTGTGRSGSGSYNAGTYSTLSSVGSVSSVHSHHPGSRIPSLHRNSLSSLPEQYPPNDGYSPHGNGESGHYPEPTSTGFVQQQQPPPQAPYGYSPVTPTPSHHGRHRYSLSTPSGEPYVVPELEPIHGYVPSQPDPSYPPNNSSGYPPNNSPGYPPNNAYPQYPPAHGFQPPAPSRTPVPSHYNPSPAPSLSSGFVPPQPPPSSLGYHNAQPQSHYPPPPPSHTPAPPRAYSQPPNSYQPHDLPPPPPASVPPQSHSAPPQQQYGHGTPSPTQSGPSSNGYPPLQPPGPPPGSRPLPIPGQQLQNSQSNLNQSAYPPAFPTAAPFQPPGPPPPPPRRSGSLPPTPTKTGQPGQLNYPPPPPPPLSNGNQHSFLPNPPGPPPPLPQVPSQYQGNQGIPPPPPLHRASLPQPYGSHSLPQTPTQSNMYGNASQTPPQHGQWNTPPPPPPLPSSSFSNSQSSYPPPPPQQNHEYDYYYNVPPPPPSQHQSWNTPPHHSVYSSWNQ
ncbi:hypothetical protein M422DRAFT_22670 [Sphaerobolus stellatus SS14]|nr:hypothetical protein M422DRAFT_22670 [Sphaerobolus stellatus SS14]